MIVFKIQGKGIFLDFIINHAHNGMIIFTRSTINDTVHDAVLGTFMCDKRGRSAHLLKEGRGIVS
jgi:hypothetical protein